MSTNTKTSEIFFEPFNRSLTQKLGQSNRKIYEEVIIQLKNILKTLVEQAAQLDAKYKQQIKELERRLADKDGEILILSQSKDSLLMSLQKFQKGYDGLKRTQSRIEGVYECDSIQLSESSKKSGSFNKNQSTPTLTEFNPDLRNTHLNQHSQFSKAFIMSKASSNMKDSIAYDFQSQSNDSANRVSNTNVPVYYCKRISQQNQKKFEQLNQKLKTNIDSGKQHCQIGKDIKENKQLTSQDKLFMLNNLSKQILSKMKKQIIKEQKSQVKQNHDSYNNQHQAKLQTCKQRDFFSKTNGSVDTPNFAKTYCDESKDYVRNFSDRFQKIQSNLNILNQSSEKNSNFEFMLNQMSFQKKIQGDSSLLFEAPLNKTADVFKINQYTDSELQINGEQNANSSRKKKINLKNSSSKKVNVVNGKYVLKSPITYQAKDLFDAKSKQNQDKKQVQKSGTSAVSGVSGASGNYSYRKSQKKSNAQKISDAKVRISKQNNRNGVNNKQKILQNHEYYIRSQRRNNKNGSSGKHFRTESNQEFTHTQMQFMNALSNRQLKKYEGNYSNKKMIRLQREKCSKSKSPKKSAKKIGSSKQKYYYQMNYKFKVPKISNLSEVTSSSFLKQVDSSHKLLKNKRSKVDKSLQVSESQGSLKSIKKIEQSQQKQNEFLNGRSSLPVMKSSHNIHKQVGSTFACKQQIRQTSCEKIASQQSIEKVPYQLNYSLKNGNYSNVNSRQSFPINSVKSMVNIVPVRQITVKNTFK